MMGLDSLGLGSAGSMSKTIMSIIGIGISAIILLTFAPKISGDVSGIALLGANDGYCEVNGEAMDRVLAKGSYTNPNEAWRATGPNKIMLTEEGDRCRASALAADTTSPVASIPYYTPQGEDLAGVPYGTGVGVTGAAAATSEATACTDTAATGSITCYQGFGEWKPQSTALAAGGLGTLVQLLFGVMGLLIPAGALGYLGSVGADLVSNKLGGGIATSILVVVVGVVVVGAILPQIIDPLDTFFAAMDGNRYYIFSVGLGKIAGTISNFFGIALIAGVIGIGMMIWKGRGSGGSSDYA